VDDGNVCNGREYCDSRLGCTTIPYHDCDDDNPCTDDRCDPVHGCIHGCFASFGDGPELPDPDDRTFVNNDGAVLGPGANPLTVDVTRYAGPTTGAHTLLYADDLVMTGLASGKAVLRIVGFGVQPDKHHVVSFNGVPVDQLNPADNSPPYLKPAGCDWSVTTFKVPFGSVRFPASRGSGGGGPPAQPNTVAVSVDGTPACLKVKGMSLSIKVMSPIILIHGNESNGGFFGRQGFGDGLDEKRLHWDNSILLPGATRERSAQNLLAFVPGIVQSFGVDSVHLVAHSKGGLDTREYLELYQPSQVPPFTVLSFTTLSTPHNGSILADISVAQSKAVKRAAKIEYPGLPAWALIVGEYLTPSLGWPSLTIEDCAHFNARNVDALPEGVIYNSVASDMDKNYDLEIGFAESWQLDLEDGWLLVLDGLTLADNVLTALYRVQRSTTSVKLRYENRDGPWGSRMLVAVIEGRHLGTQYGSDPMVTTRSGLGTGGWSRRTRNNALLTGSEGRNHASVADGGVAALVREWLIAAERENGDLK
jgi:pimeloyl-ACP methyl ester carboxylesterase